MKTKKWISALMIVAAPMLMAGVAGADPGQDIFQKKCINCHGATGAGDGKLAAMLETKPADLSDAKIMGAVDDEFLHKIVAEGGPSVGKSVQMPAAKGLSPEEIDAVVAYVRTLSK